MKTILIPTDFSDNAGDALDYALHVFAESACRIHIVNVVDVTVVPSEIPVSNVDIIGPRIEDARNSMEALKEYGKIYADTKAKSPLEITTEVAIGTISHSIKDAAKEVEADVIIMGTQGTEHNMVEKVVGTVSTAVLSSAPCPVILIPKDYKFKAIDNMIYATNLDSGDPYELWRATQVIKPHTGQIRCVYVAKDIAKLDTKKLQDFAKYFVEHSPSLQTIFNVEEGKSIEATLADYADTYDAQLIIMHRSKKTFLDRLFSPRHTQKMASWITVPLLVMDQE